MAVTNGKRILRCANASQLLDHNKALVLLTAWLACPSALPDSALIRNTVRYYVKDCSIAAGKGKIASTAAGVTQNRVRGQPARMAADFKLRAREEREGVRSADVEQTTRLFLRVAPCTLFLPVELLLTPFYLHIHSLFHSQTISRASFRCSLSLLFCLFVQGETGKGRDTTRRKSTSLPPLP